MGASTLADASVFVHREVLEKLIRIVGVQRNADPQREFVVLQNQGSLRVNLRGHMVLADHALSASDFRTAHAFGDDALIPAGIYVVLVTGRGQARWSKTKDGSLLYYTYMNRDESVWQYSDGALHVLATQHTYATNRQPALVLR